MRVVSAPKDVSAPGPHDLRYVLFSRTSDRTCGIVGATILAVIRKLGLQPVPRAWDLLSIALSVVAADESCSRSSTADGWSRDIDLTIAVQDPAFWMQHKTQLENALRFLTTDRWGLSFIGGGVLPKPPTGMVARQEDMVCLLSGGLDSLIGALDLQSSGRRPLLVSQIAKGNKNFQQVLGRIIGGNRLHLQLNHNASPPSGFSERSQRARSIIFIAYGVLAATSLDRYREGQSVDLYVPENGFISLNVPLTPLRLASHSTRTTHPFYIGMVQQVLDVAGLKVRIVNPYQFRTKGEMLVGCLDQPALKKYAGQTTSCGRYARNAFIHCGRCVPCLIRRAAFYAWECDPTQPQYRYADLSKHGHQYRDFDDVRSVAAAIATVDSHGFDAWIGGALNAVQLGDTALYRDVAARGLGELKTFMQSIGVV